jgi:hypothetical protein
MKYDWGSYLSTYEDGTKYSGTVAFKLQMWGNHPEESIQTSKMFV